MNSTLNLTLFHAAHNKTGAAQIAAVMRALRVSFSHFSYSRCLELTAEAVNEPVGFVQFTWIGCNEGNDSL